MSSSADKHLQQLQRQFLESLPQRAHQLEDLWRHLRYLNWTEQGFKTFQQLVHRLVGSGTSFGLPDITQTAQLLDNYIQEHQESGQPIGGIEIEMIDKMIRVLVRSLNNPTTTETLAPQSLNEHDGDGRHIFIVEADHALSALMSAYLQTAGYSVQHFDTPAACIQQLNLQAPHAVLIDPGMIGDNTQAFEAIKQIKARVMQGVPIIFLSARTDMNTRLRALRAGCASYITKPIEFSSLVSSLAHTIQSNEITHKVMIVDDEELVARYHAEILRHAHMDVICVTQPMQSLERAIEFKPDLVILDMHMPHINGIELATLMRQDPQFLLLPIIFVTADTSLRLRQSIESIGVNAVLTKPVDVTALINACERAISDTHSLKHRIESVTQRAQLNNQVTRSYFYAAIDNELQEDHSHRTPTALYYLGLDIKDTFYEQFGSSGVAKLHEQFCLKLSHIMGSEEQWSDLSDFVACVLVGKRTHEQHQQRATQLAENLSSQVYCIGDQVFVIHTHIGIHYLDTETGSANSAVAHAERAYELAKKIGTGGLSHTQEEPLPLEANLSTQEFSEQLPEDNLRICYQPMLSLEKPNIEHYEALVRWQIDDNELIPAAKFLHYIEHSSMRVDLDRWVLQSAVNAIATDTYARENANLFIHLADETLAQKSFFSFAANVLRSSRLRGQRRLIFIFEEPWVVLHPEEATDIINSLHNIQCGTCLSHAGATPSAEQVIRQMEFDYVRLAPTITTQIDNNSKQEQQLREIVEAAQFMGTQIIATQVEDPKNLSTLWMLGVRLFQGFLLQSPDQSIHSHNDLDMLKQFFANDH